MTPSKIQRAGQEQSLSETERMELKQHEDIIEKGKIHFLFVGNSLSRISAQRLYRESHQNFHDYVLQRWGFARSQGYRLIQASETASELKKLSPTGDELILPKTERAFRALMRVKNPKHQLELLQQANQLYGNAELTHKQIMSLGQELGYLRPKKSSRTEPENTLTTLLTKLEESISSGAKKNDLLQITKQIRNLINSSHTAQKDQST